MYKNMIFREIETLDIKGRFKFYPYLVCGVDRKIYQLTHFKRRRTVYFREIKYNKDRNGYQINGAWVSYNRLVDDNNFIPKIETIEILK